MFDYFYSCETLLLNKQEFASFKNPWKNKEPETESKLNRNGNNKRKTKQG